MTVSADQEPAVQVHDEQSELFRERYRRLDAGGYDSAFTYGRYRLAKVAALRLGSGEGRRALDVGCGSGWWLQWLKSNMFEVTGVDPASAMLAEARSTVQAPLVQGDARKLPFGDDSFDVVLCIEVIRYLSEPEAALNEIMRVLRPGGTAMITAAPLLSLHGYGLLNRAFTTLKPRGFTHLRQYFVTLGSFQRLLTSAGFNDASVGACFLGPFVWLDRFWPSLAHTLLRGWAPIDARVAGTLGTRNFCNHFVAFANKPVPQAGEGP